MIFSYFISFIKKNKIKIAVLVFSIAIYFTLAVVIATLSGSLTEIAAAPFKKIGVETVVQKEGQIPSQMLGAIFPHSNGPMYQDELSDLSKLEFVQTHDAALYFWYFDDTVFKTILGIESDGSTFSRLLKLNIERGEFSLSEKKVIITADFAQKNNLTEGDGIAVGESDFIVAGILQSNVSDNVIPADMYIAVREAQNIVSASEEMERIYAFKDDTFTNVMALGVDPQWQGDKEAAIKNIDEEYIVFSEKTFSNEVVEQIKLVSFLGKVMFIVLGILLLIIFSLLIVYNNKTREKEIAVFRMIGWSFTDLKKQFMAEGAFLLIIALIIGNISAVSSLWVISQQSISLELPWEISAKPHFLPQENAIDRTITTNFPVHFDIWIFVWISLAFLIIFGAINYIAFQRLKNIKPARFLK